MSIENFNIDNEEEVSDIPNKPNSTESFDYFLSDENFERLRQLQLHISGILGISVKVKKLANLLITEENTEKLKHQLLSQLKI